MQRGYASTEQKVDEFRATLMSTPLELGDCQFCPDEAVMLLNGVAMCQRCGDENRDIRFYDWLDSQSG